MGLIISCNVRVENPNGIPSIRWPGYWRVKVHDEGELWETGSHARLRRKLNEYNQCVAAFGGALKDAAGAAGLTVQSEIHNHPDFEHLEASGLAALGERIDSAVRVVKRLASESIS